MFLKRLLILNSGPTERCSIELPFHADGPPKPLLLVGGNGSGKTNVLSIIADGLMEIAASRFQDVLPQQGVSRSYYRMVGGRCRRSGAAYDVALLHFRDPQDRNYYFRAHSGTVPFADLGELVSPFAPVCTPASDPHGKVINADGEAVEQTFRAGVYTFFPASRNELPFWFNSPTLDRDPTSDASPRISNLLRKRLVIERGLNDLKPWIIDLILDQSIDIFQIVGRPLETLAPLFQRHIMLSEGVQSLNILLRAILGRPDARIVRNPRTFDDRRLAINFGEGQGLPSLDALSAGQGTLLSIFGNVFRLGTSLHAVPTFANCRGICLVDEIDTHLHADLQYSALPQLMKLFPNVQFIVTAHSPLFPLGMENAFGVDGFEIRDLPTAQKISSERYSEFLASFEMYRATREFEKSLATVAAGGKLLVIGEGQTDPMYFKAAAELLGFSDVVAGVEFTHIGALDPGERKTNGKDRLKTAATIYRVTPDLLKRPIICVYDQKVTGDVFEEARLVVTRLPTVEDHPYTDDGPESLLPIECFTEDFLSRSGPIVRKGKRIETTEIKKVALAEHLCATIRNPAHFEAFRPLLERIRAFLEAHPPS